MKGGLFPFVAILRIYFAHQKRLKSRDGQDSGWTVGVSFGNFYYGGFKAISMVGVNKFFDHCFPSYGKLANFFSNFHNFVAPI